MKKFTFNLETDPNDQYDTGDLFETIANATRPTEDPELLKTVNTLDRSVDQLTKLRDLFKS